MRLLLIGSDYTWSIEKLFLRYFGEMTPDLKLFPAQNYFYDWYNRSILHKLVYRAGLSPILKKINRQLRQTIEEFKPTAIFVFKGMEVFPETLQWAKDKGILLANFNPDNPFVFTGAGSGNANVTRSIGLYDIHFTYNLEIKARLEKEFGLPTVLLPFAFDVSNELYEASRSQEEVNKVCFMGNPDDKRVVFLKGLLDNGIAIDVYGHHWEKFIRHENLSLCGAAYGDDFWKTLRKYRVQLNLMRVHNEQSHNMRSFEIPGIGGIMLAPDTPEHRLFFEQDKEIFLFNDVAECVAQIKKLQTFSPDQAEAVRLRARARSLDSGYRYKDRAQTVFDHLAAAAKK